MTTPKRIHHSFLICFSLFLAAFLFPFRASAENMEEMGIVKLQSLDKVTARTMNFEVEVGSTVKFGQIFIKVQSCKKSAPVDQPEAASFLQIWQNNVEGKPEWIFSGWMFASSPGLSAMDHPIYDVWVIDCLPSKQPAESPEEQQENVSDVPETEDTPQ